MTTHRKTVTLSWGPDEDLAVAVKGHGLTADELNAAVSRELGGEFEATEVSEVWVCIVPDRTGYFTSRWVQVDKSNRRAQAWTIAEETVEL